eukprot:354266-Chlamydomonas_euryale.AAC.12
MHPSSPSPRDAAGLAFPAASPRCDDRRVDGAARPTTPGGATTKGTELETPAAAAAAATATAATAATAAAGATGEEAEAAGAEWQPCR